MTNSIENIGTAAKHTASALNHMVGQADLLSKCVSGFNAAFLHTSDTLVKVGNILDNLSLSTDTLFNNFDQTTEASALNMFGKTASSLPASVTSGTSSSNSIPFQPTDLIAPMQLAASLINGAFDQLALNINMQLNSFSQNIESVIARITTSLTGLFEQITKPFETIGSKLTPISTQLNAVLLSVQQSVVSTGSIIANTLIPAFGILFNLGSPLEQINGLITGISAICSGLAKGHPLAEALAVSFGVLTAAMIANYVAGGHLTKGNMQLIAGLVMTRVKNVLLAQSYKKTALAMLATPWGMYAAAAAGIIILFAKLCSGLNKFGQAKKEISSKAAETYANERMELDKLYKKLQKTAAGSEERRKLVEEIKQIVPSISSGLENELIYTNNLTEAYKKLTKEAKRSAFERAKAEVLTERSKKLIKLQIEYDEEFDKGKNGNLLQKGWFYTSLFNGQISFKKSHITDLETLIDKIAATNTFGGVDLLSDEEKEERKRKYLETKTKVTNGINRIRLLFSKEEVTEIKEVKAKPDKDDVIKLLKKIPDKSNPFKKLAEFYLKMLNPDSVDLKTGNGLNGGSEVETGISSTVTGGAKSTNITINIGNMVEKMSFTAADMRQNVQDMQDQVLDALIRTINMSQSAAI